jgi:hypothetical protein
MSDPASLFPDADAMTWFAKEAATLKSSIKRSLIVKRRDRALALDKALADLVAARIQSVSVIQSPDGSWTLLTPDTYHGPSPTFEPLLDQLLPNLFIIKASPPITPKPRKSEVSPGPCRVCGCGCGNQTKSHRAVFLPGHDGRLASMVLKLERGEIDEHDVPLDTVTIWNRWVKAGRPGGEDHPKLRDIVLSLG